MTVTADIAVQRDDAAVRVWLYCLCALIFAMILVGGATRLTDSGLSITEWQPILGIVPPMSDAAWQDAFEKYKQIPEYQLINKGMSLPEFKFIYWWEWGHRFLGRMIGFAFLIPFLYFWARGYLARGMIPKLVIMFVLGGLQGALGWYMVMSGLVERTDVSQYRLAAHLSAAVLIFGYIFWVTARMGREHVSAPPASDALRLSAIGLTVAVFVQIALGAFVAGMDAGQGYNTWPLMDGAVIPDGLGVMSPWYLNLFENALTVQFNHRVVAYLVLVWALVHAILAIARSEPGAIAVSAGLLAVAALVQVVIGIATLLAHVPLSLALLHQGVAIVLFAAVLWHLNWLVPAPAPDRR
ncbi:MAG: COX15/CtaA family protein [Hyphomicrobiaceae bacterium]|nr:COX15/CtaA family protein [Hyphomicrobiaceae bacterium]